MTTKNTKPRDYSKGKIYKIEAINGEPDDIYIGSTTKEFLSQRMAKHSSGFKKWLENNDKNSYVTSFKLFEKYGIENCKIILLENVNTSSLDELKCREAYYIKSMNCVNKYIPLRTRKEYRTDNKVYIKEINQKWYDKNKDRLKAKREMQNPQSSVP